MIQANSLPLLGPRKLYNARHGPLHFQILGLSILILGSRVSEGCTCPLVLKPLVVLLLQAYTVLVNKKENNLYSLRVPKFYAFYFIKIDKYNIYVKKFIF